VPAPDNTAPPRADAAAAPPPPPDTSAPPEDAAPPEEPADAASGDAGGAGELLPWVQHAIRAELEVPRTVAETTLSWFPRVVVKGHPFVAPRGLIGGGVYIVIRSDGKPLYVGEASNFASRWRGRLLSAHQIGLTGDDGALPRPITVYFGRLPPGHASQDPARKAVEHVVVRTLVHGGLVGPKELRNRRSILELRVKGQVSVANVLPPQLLGRMKRAVKGLSGGSLHLSDDTRFETGAP